MDFFGWSVSVSGDVTVVGARSDDDTGRNSGSAYVFRRAGGSWIDDAKLTASDGGSQDFFGTSVSLDGDVAVVGTEFARAAYIFRRVGGSWTEESKLVESGSGGFGAAVAVSGDVAVVGAPRDRAAGSFAGSAYVFERSDGEWSRATRLRPAGLDPGDEFGRSVAVDGDVVVIGSPEDDDFAASGGSAYVFERSGGGWSRTARLKADGPGAGDRFGGSVAVSGDVAVVGAREDGGGASGSAYVFAPSGTSWSQQIRLVPGDASDGDRFGWSVAVDGDFIVVGASFEDENGPESGAAYVFQRSGDGWAETDKVTPSDGASGDLFGFSVSVDGNAVVIGAMADDDHGPSSGSAYAFALSPVRIVDIDILPGSEVNRVRPGPGGAVPVAVLGEPDFDAPVVVDRASLTFGADGDESSLVLRGRTGEPNCWSRDGNDDDLADLVCLFSMEAAGFEATDKTGVLQGQTTDGTRIRGADDVTVVGTP